MPKRTVKQPQQFKLSLEFEGKRYEASYFIQSGAVTVTSAYGSISTHVGVRAESTARMLLREILDGAKGRGRWLPRMCRIVNGKVKPGRVAFVLVPLMQPFSTRQLQKRFHRLRAVAVK